MQIFRNYSREFIAPYSINTCVSRLRSYHEKPIFEGEGMRTHVDIWHVESDTVEFRILRTPQGDLPLIEYDYDYEHIKHTTLMTLTGVLYRQNKDLNTLVILDKIQIPNWDAVMWRGFMAWIIILVAVMLVVPYLVIWAFVIGIPLTALILGGRLGWRWLSLRRIVYAALRERQYPER
jgi:hypothetical protein